MNDLDGSLVCLRVVHIGVEETTGREQGPERASPMCGKEVTHAPVPDDLPL